MNKKGVMVKDARVLILGITFKENCPDIRNTKIVDIYSTMQEYTQRITVFDPWADAARVKKEYGIDLTAERLDDLKGQFDAVILGVAHKAFGEYNLRDFLRDPVKGVVYDVKGVANREQIDGRL